MTVDEQERQCVRVRKELKALKIECAAVSEALKAFGNSLVAEGRKLIDAPDSSSFCADTLCSDARLAVAQAARYRELLVSIESKQAASDAFGDLVP